MYNNYSFCSHIPSIHVYAVIVAVKIRHHIHTPCLFSSEASIAQTQLAPYLMGKKIIF